MAHKKGSGSSKNGRDSNASRLGVKKFGGQAVTSGSIIIRQDKQADGLSQRHGQIAQCSGARCAAVYW